MRTFSHPSGYYKLVDRETGVERTLMLNKLEAKVIFYLSPKLGFFIYPPTKPMHPATFKGLRKMNGYQT